MSLPEYFPWAMFTTVLTVNTSQKEERWPTCTFEEASSLLASKTISQQAIKITWEWSMTSKCRTLENWKIRVRKGLTRKANWLLWSQRVQVFRYQYQKRVRALLHVSRMTQPLLSYTVAEHSIPGLSVKWRLFILDIIDTYKHFNNSCPYWGHDRDTGCTSQKCWPCPGPADV